MCKLFQKREINLDKKTNLLRVVSGVIEHLGLGNKVFINQMALDF